MTKMFDFIIIRFAIYSNFILNATGDQVPVS